VGLLGAMALVTHGFESYVYAREPLPNPKADVLRKIGVEYLSEQDHSLEAMAETVGNVDLVHEAAGASHLAFQMIQLWGANGIFISTGVPGRKAPVEIDTNLMTRNRVLKNQVVFGTVNAGRDTFEASINDLVVFSRRWPETVRSLITGRLPMDAPRDLLLGGADGIKNVIQLN
jgi:glucose 1-dehydrogenase